MKASQQKCPGIISLCLVTKPKHVVSLTIEPFNIFVIVKQKQWQFPVLLCRTQASLANNSKESCPFLALGLPIHNIWILGEFIYAGKTNVFVCLFD